MRGEDFNKTRVISKLRQDFDTLVNLVNISNKSSISNHESHSSDDSENESENGHLTLSSSSSSSSYTILKSILDTLKKHYDYHQEQQQMDGNSDHNDSDYHKNNNTNFIRTNLSDYNRRRIPSKEQQEQPTQKSDSLSSSLSSISSRNNPAIATTTDSVDVTLRTILESKSAITKLLHTLIEIMTSSNYSNDREYDDDDDDDEHNNCHNDLPPSSILACHVYLQLSLLSGSWSTGWIDMVAMR